MNKCRTKVDDMKQLWNRNFTILTIGSIISAFGNAGASVAFGFLIYAETKSPLLLALFIVSNIIPRLLTNMFIGPFIDRTSRKKIIVILDLVISLFFAVIGSILWTGYFNMILFTVLAMLFGVIDTIYQVAFMSLFPEVVTQGMHSKAYSISSIIWPISAAIMTPLAAYLQEQVLYGIAILMIANAVIFFITALIETQIKLTEKLNQSAVQKGRFRNDIKEGILYYKKERGILGIGLLFACFSFVYAASDILRMPFFVNHPVYTLQDYSFIVSAGAIGRLLGGTIHYMFKYPVHKKFLIAVSVYFTVEILSATLLFMPYVFMVIFSFIVGLLSVTSFNIRMSSTQVYIPSSIRGRVNSTQQLLWNLGSIIGAIVIGLTAEYSGIAYQYIILMASIVSLSAIVIFPIRLRSEFKKIYNVDV
jgi:DHA3 family macrolide efflux protein-like MFS transporter